MASREDSAANPRFPGRVITTGSQGQPQAREEEGFVRLTLGRGKWLLSAAVAEELAISLNHAARRARGDV